MQEGFSELRPYCYRAAASNRSFMPAHQQKHSNTKHLPGSPNRLAVADKQGVEPYLI
jgi:hypothetical protein